MFFKDYNDTKLIYHVSPITELKYIIENGLKLNQSSGEYHEFNKYFDAFKPENIPEWVSREKAIYASMNYKKDHKWHSHSVILSVKIDENKCWVGNENLANILYEPFVLSRVPLFKNAKYLLASRGKEYAVNYWNHSLSFTDNLKKRLDKTEGYDAEVMIMHDIPPRDISIVKLISDNEILGLSEWDAVFLKLCNGV